MIRGNKFVRLEDWISEKSNSSERQHSRDVGFYTGKHKQTVIAISDSIHSWEMGSDRFEGLRIPAKESATKRKILDPQSSFLQKWNMIFLLVCLLALSLDPFFFYIPVIDGFQKCLHLDRKLGTITCVLRTLLDLSYALRMIFQFRTGFIASSSHSFGKGKVVEDPVIIARRYLTSNLIIDVISILPLPQYVPRFMRIYPLFKELRRSSCPLMERRWVGIGYNIFLGVLFSHVIGACWYFFSVEREETCWRRACEAASCHSKDLYCGNHRANNALSTFLEDSCPSIQLGSNIFNFGMFTDAVDSGVVGSWNFSKKFIYCFWWGLHNLSSFGQNLQTSTYIGEILFALVVSVTGMALISMLINTMIQVYLQSLTVRLEEMRVKMRDVNQWMSHRMLPEDLRERIRTYEQYKWRTTRGVDEKNIIDALPKYIRRDIYRHLYFDLIMRVPKFAKMDEQMLDAICDHLRPVLYTKDSLIFREGDAVDEMLFILNGDLVSVTTNGAVYLKAGDFYGEGLLTWALDPRSKSKLHVSSRTVLALSEVEAFALLAQDLKFVASQFQHTFRYFSVQWRTWAAGCIQAAWRRHCRRKQAKPLC
ncbi:hypothetical protein JCGZ_13170 [Jatropha curcas]|uniref:Cyclic nucleotide-binding domain-containing protein n=1 Tax=Jatropha curcas TaxID=180498 RepID=A0A067KK39_JATCU|nr:cyclic nucleotide-gated ion channel 1 isoform X2 [Jatropha curcas]KDP32620.1 hypothetical protein JCGZ_13170 [Jatropha curcas]